jgi:hypothetical protein
MAYRVGQAVFAKGEISDELVARFDVGSYKTALRKALNVVILKYGGVTKRPGTRLVAPVYKDQGVRLMPFQYSLEQTYVMEMGQGYMRLAALGGMVIEEKLTITSVTRGATTTIGVAFHGYSVGDQVYFSGVQGCEDLNGKIVTVLSVPDANTIVVNLDTRDYGAFTGDTGGITRTGAPPAPPADPVVPPPAADPPPPDLGGWGDGRGTPLISI